MTSKVSVILSTYNGEKYIEEQLESIRCQTVVPNEVIIKDDCSYDNTVNIVNNYIETKELGNWKVIVNDKNLGWKKNFVSLLEFATGDYIFFCDQDDIWHEDKIEKMVNCIIRNDNIEVLVSDYSVFVDGETKNYIKERKKRTGLEKYYPKNNFLYTYYPGCTYCITKSLIGFYKNYWNESFPHDAFAWHIANCRGTLYILHEKLIEYRRHSNTVTGRTVGDRNKRLKDLEFYQKVVDLYKNSNINTTIANRKLVCIEKWVKNRYYLLTNRNLVFAVLNLPYLNYYWSLKTYLMDIICSVKCGE